MNQEHKDELRKFAEARMQAGERVAPLILKLLGFCDAQEKEIAVLRETQVSLERQIEEMTKSEVEKDDKMIPTRKEKKAKARGR